MLTVELVDDDFYPTLYLKVWHMQYNILNSSITYGLGTQWQEECWGMRLSTKDPEDQQ